MEKIDNYECDKCGACCKGPLLVEVYELDVMREPTLATADISQWTVGKTAKAIMEELRDETKCLFIAGGDKSCHFLDDENMCEIYPTRPTVCVDMQAGDECCQDARKAHGIESLMPTTE